MTPDLRDLQRAGNVQVINGMMKKINKKKSNNSVVQFLFLFISVLFVVSPVDVVLG